MKIIVRNRNKKIENISLASKEELVWIEPQVLEKLSKDAFKTAIDFMEANPKIHEVKFSTLPELDPDEDEESFDAYDQPQGDQQGDGVTENSDNHD